MGVVVSSILGVFALIAISILSVISGFKSTKCKDAMFVDFTITAISVAAGIVMLILMTLLM